MRRASSAPVLKPTGADFVTFQAQVTGTTLRIVISACRDRLNRQFQRRQATLCAYLRHDRLITRFAGVRRCRRSDVEPLRALINVFAEVPTLYSPMIAQWLTLVLRRVN